MRGERDELTLQFVQAPELALLDRLLEKDGRKCADRRQELELVLAEGEFPATAIGAQKPQAAGLADQRHDNKRPKPQQLDGHLGKRLLLRDVAREGRPARFTRIPEDREP